MIGIVIVTHGQLGREIIKTAEFIGGSLDGCATVSVDSGQGPDSILQAIEQAIKSVSQGAGVLLLTDMFGGTPSNVGLSFLSEGKVEVVTGVNLPMFIKAIQLRGKMALAEAAQAVGEAGHKSITVASEIMGGK
ncbi:MAG: PTS sugar transporter [Candidatus Adiutrix sp.]|jgi:PTS system mannose-specific IIA component|nr:PTS sugar transporter [Candidatus Adiutrix sp.]